jgi:hypothetical protein
MVGASDDVFEREADRVADRVMRMPDATVRRKCAACEQEDERNLHRKAQQTMVARASARAGGDGLPAPDGVHGAISSSFGRALDGATRAFFEPRFGADLSGVRVHTDAPAVAASEAVSARAFTLGSGIYFAAGEYRPHSGEGRRLLAHELTHVLQQGGQGASPATVRRTVQAGNVDCNPPAATDAAVVGANPLATLRAADQRAIDVLTTAHDSLEYSRTRIIAGEPPSWPVISDQVGVGLRRIMRINPESAAVWTGTGPGSVFMVMRRFEIVRGLLRSGTINYHCRSPAGACGVGCGAPCCTPTANAASCFGIFHNFLCDPFWGRGRGPLARACTVMHEPFHMSFNFVGDAGRLANAHCYARLAFWINGEDSPPDLHTQCPLGR